MENEEQKNLPKPQTDLPLPEKELESGEITAETQPIVGNVNPHKEKGHLIRAFLFGFLFVVLIAIIGGGFFLLGKKSTNIENKQTAETVILSPSPTPDPTADWGSFKSSQFGFILKYPKTITPTENSSPFYAVIFKKTNVVQGEFDSYTLLANPYTFIAKNPAAYDYISADIVDSLMNLKQDETKQISTVTFTKLSEKVVDGEPATIVSVTSSDGSTHQKRAIFKNKGNMYMLVDEQNGEPTVFDYMLSTFKFTDSSTNPTPTCRPRPSCLDTEPKCKIAETQDMCPPKSAN